MVRTVEYVKVVEPHEVIKEFGSESLLRDYIGFGGAQHYVVYIQGFDAYTYTGVASVTNCLGDSGQEMNQIRLSFRFTDGIIKQPYGYLEEMILGCGYEPVKQAD